MQLRNLKPRVAATKATALPILQDGGWRTSTQSAAARGYDHAWTKRRAHQLRIEPTCRYCNREGRLTLATVADHIVPHRGNKALFAGPLQSLCKACHDGTKAMEEREAGWR